MPIIEPARPGAPLTQGDILSGVALFATKGSWEERGGQAAVTTSDLCLVLSRPCVAAHKRHVVVAGVASKLARLNYVAGAELPKRYLLA
jgi:hypothetical protein